MVHAGDLRKNNVVRGFPKSCHTWVPERAAMLCTKRVEAHLFIFPLVGQGMSYIL